MAKSNTQKHIPSPSIASPPPTKAPSAPRRPKKSTKAPRPKKPTRSPRPAKSINAILADEFATEPFIGEPLRRSMRPRIPVQRYVPPASSAAARVKKPRTTGLITAVSAARMREKISTLLTVSFDVAASFGAGKAGATEHMRMLCEEYLRYTDENENPVGRMFG